MMNYLTENEVIALIHEDTADACKVISDYVEKWELERKEIIELLREVSEEKYAQAIVVRLRDDLNR